VTAQVGGEADDGGNEENESYTPAP
jgi:hypothetical protein